MASIPNDEPVYEDYLNHFPLVKQVGNMILDCESPYVLGICGAWGSGKTSFLRKLWAYLGGSLDLDVPVRQRERRESYLRKKWFGQDYRRPDTPKRQNGWHVVWFNPWQHQFEETPLVALLVVSSTVCSRSPRSVSKPGYNPG
jgi:hypothetical protein